jgi:hypothetical protein
MSTKRYVYVFFYIEPPNPLQILSNLAKNYNNQEMVIEEETQIDFTVGLD